MEIVHGRIFADQSHLTPTQAVDLDIAWRACAAFWNAALRHDYKTEHLRPHGRCIYSALAVLDILKGMGRDDASVQKVGLDVRQLRSDGSVVRGLGIGHPRYAPVSSRPGWNAHLTVRVGDLLIDPSVAQAQRSWNDLPHYCILAVGTNRLETIDICGEPVQVKASWAYQLDGDTIQLTYHDLLRAQDIATRGFRKVPDAKPEARADIVAIALDEIGMKRKSR